MRHGRPDGSVPRIAALDQVSLRARIGILAALVAALAVVLVSVAAFVTVRANILETLDANLLQRASAAAQSELADPRQLATIPTEVLGAGDIRLALLLSDGRASSAEGQASAPPLGVDELAVAQGVETSSTRTASEDGIQYRVVAVQAGPGQALVIAQRLDSTQQVLTKLGVALPIVGGIGVVLAAFAASSSPGPDCGPWTGSPPPPSGWPPLASCGRSPSRVPTSWPGSPAASTTCSVRSPRPRNSNAASSPTPATSCARR